MKLPNLNPNISQTQRLQNYAMQINRAVLNHPEGINTNNNSLMHHALVIRVVTPGTFAVEYYEGNGKFIRACRFDLEYLEVVHFLDGMCVALHFANRGHISLQAFMEPKIHRGPITVEFNGKVLP